MIRKTRGGEELTCNVLAKTRGRMKREQRCSRYIIVSRHVLRHDGLGWCHAEEGMAAEPKDKGGICPHPVALVPEMVETPQRMHGDRASSMMIGASAG